ncbi:hypothetical protein ACFSR7_36090 [Cohnella sp. GCM10020058]|uniref:hypothetical protein n=1 Tax=Cohnella sp. GCM10020058 TaxID=3317330 RepID=UPI003637BA3A
MARVRRMIQLDLDPQDPVNEAIATIVAMMPYNQGHEDAILQGVKEAIERLQAQREKGVKQDG